MFVESTSSQRVIMACIAELIGQLPFWNVSWLVKAKLPNSLLVPAAIVAAVLYCSDGVIIDYTVRDFDSTRCNNIVGSVETANVVKDQNEVLCFIVQNRELCLS